MGNQAQDKLPRKAAAAARKAHALQSRLARQQARIIAAMNLVGRARGRSGVATSAFSSGANFGASLFGRPKSSIRAKSAEGLSSFHFQVVPVSRGSAFTERLAGRTTPKPGGSSTSASSHQLYIEREGAVETVDKIKSPQAHKVKDGPETRDQSSNFLMTPDDKGYAASASAYIDRDGVVENLSSFGNIAPNLKDRIEFWKLIEDAERKPAKHQITVNPALDPEFWKKIEADPNAPKFLKEIAQDPPDEIVTDLIFEKDAFKIHDYFLAHRTTASEEAQAIAFAPGRGGRVQSRLIVDLPADMTPEQRLEIAQIFCDRQFAKKDAPYHCAIHRPTKANDSRHYHLHITFHDRPAKKMIDPSSGITMWDFEIIERKKDSSRHYSTTRSHQQPKIREFQDRGWPKQARKDFCEIVNAVRAKNRTAPIYDHRKYSEMGITYEVLPTLSRAEFHDVQRGVANSTAASKIEKRWERALIKEADETRLQLPDKAITKRYAVLLAGVTKRAPVSAVAVKACHGAYLDSIKRINDARLDRAALKVAIEKELTAVTPEIGLPSANAKSRADMLRQLHEHLAKPLAVQEALARESQALAVEKLRSLEKQLKSISPGSLALPLRSLGDLAARAGLSGILQMLQSTDDPIIRPDPAPVPRSGASVAPAAPRVAPQMKSDPQKVTPAIVVPPSAPTQSHVAPQPDKKPASIVEPRRLPDPQMWRITPVSRKTSPAPPQPIKKDPVREASKNRTDQAQSTTPSAPPADKNRTIPQPATPPPAARATTIELKPKAPDTPVSFKTQADKTALKSPAPPQPDAIKPGNSLKAASPLVPASKSTTPVSPSGKPWPYDHKTVKRTATPMTTETTTPPPPPPPPAPSDEQARKEKERRDRRRAILTAPQLPPRGRGGHER